MFLSACHTEFTHTTHPNFKYLTQRQGPPPLDSAGVPLPRHDPMLQEAATIVAQRHSLRHLPTTAPGLLNWGDANQLAYLREIELEFARVRS